MSFKQCLESGLDFIEFLGERGSDISKKELREIYNSEFREGVHHPRFGSVFSALWKFKKIYIKRGKVVINNKPRWRKPRGPQQWQQEAPGCGPQEPPETAGTASGCSPPVLTPKRKLATEVIRKLNTNRKELTSDKRGIKIESDPETKAGKVQFTVDRLKELFTLRFIILNHGPDCIYFTYYTALHRMHCFTMDDKRRVSRPCPLFLCPGESYEVLVHYRLNHFGYFPAVMYFEFCPDPPESMPFCIVREIEASARSLLAVELGPVSPYKPYQAVTYKKVKTTTVLGVPVESTVIQPLKMEVQLLDYNYPQLLKELAKQRMEDSEYLSPAARQRLPSVKNLLSSPLKMKNYADRFHLLLHLEEIQMEVDIRRYDLYKQTMTQDRSNRKLLTLRVPGVAENRPSVLRGDCLRVSNSEDKNETITVYTGYVHRVELDRLKLGFSKRLLENFISNMKFDVEFTINRYPLRVQHRAVAFAEKHRLEEILFPSGAAVANFSMPNLRMSNRLLDDNPQQREAVQRIVAGASKPAPHLVFGPPGTGKTITLVEAMIQVNKANPSVHILACAPSNSACDLLCERLMVHMDRHLVYRLYASSRDPASVPKDLLKYSNWDETQDCFLFPAKEDLMKYKVLVTTMITAGRLVSGGIPVGHFTHVFLDEGGQAVEPECIIAIAGLLSTELGQLVLAGDPKQLGPILRSPLALNYGLGVSLLERLMMENTLYQKSADTGYFNTRFVTKLLRNYRSHPAILKIPNELFYDNELQVFAEQGDRETYCNWEYLPKKGFPLIFHAVLGKDEREANSPSFFNVSEIEVLVDYLDKLMETQGKKGLPKLSPKDIGIIAPYRKQVEKIKKALKSMSVSKQWHDFTELKVGSVEEFQGQERRIIMVSTVRSSHSYVKMDSDFNIGFLSNEKRFNVAMTRARSLLIVVGNPVILNKDPTWEKFISYCLKEKGYTGFDLKDIEGEADMVARLTSLKISTDPGPATEEGPLQQHVETEWRNEQ